MGIIKVIKEWHDGYKRWKRENKEEAVLVVKIKENGKRNFET